MGGEATLNEIYDRLGSIDAKLEEGRRRHEEFHGEIKTIRAKIDDAPGIDADDKERAELRADAAHLRRWRKSVEKVETVGVSTVVTVIVTGLLGAIGVAIKMMFWRG